MPKYQSYYWNELTDLNDINRLRLFTSSDFSYELEGESTYHVKLANEELIMENNPPCFVNYKDDTIMSSKLFASIYSFALSNDIVKIITDHEFERDAKHRVCILQLDLSEPRNIPLANRVHLFIIDDHQSDYSKFKAIHITDFVINHFHGLTESDPDRDNMITCSSVEDVYDVSIKIAPEIDIIPDADILIRHKL